LAPLVVQPLAVASYASLISLLWFSFKRWYARVIWVALLLPVVLAAFFSFTGLILLFGMFEFPRATGRSSPTVTWRTDWTSMSFTSDWVEYSIYTNPHWFPLLKREIADQRCNTSEIVDGNPAFRLTPDGNSVIVACRKDDGSTEDIAHRIR
jgi:hypothetical protein